MTDQNSRWALLVHGGAKQIEPDEEQANREGVIAAASAGRAVLEAGGSALDAVESAIRVLEELPVFNAGRGSVRNAAGEIEMCAAMMDGRDLSVGAVSVIRQVRHPIEIARRLLPEKETLLAGDGAVAFAQEQGFEFVSDEYLKVEGPEEGHDTVGAVALDASGNLAAGTSTGGLDGSRVGRVGDSPLAGSGLYADNQIGAVSLSGDGETISRLVLATRILDRVLDEGPEQAITQALVRLPAVGGEDADGGAIAVTRDGRAGWAHNSPHFAVALATPEMDEPRAWLHKDEER